MTIFRPTLLFVFAAFCALSIGVGCSSGRKEKPEVKGDAGEKPAATAEGGKSDKEPSASQDEPVVELEPFDPPTLEELDQMAEWEDRPVRDPMQMLKEHLAKTPPEITDEEALSLRNTGSEENAKIRSALGRPPKDDSEVNWEASITRHLLGDIKTTNAIMINSTHEFDVFAMVHVGLFTFDWDLMPFASSDMVEKWQTSKDRMYDKVVMRRDCVWSDGTPMTAQDVAFTFRAIMNSKIPVPALRSHAVHLKDVVAYDDYTLVYFHKEPLATNDWNLHYSILPKHIFEPLYAKLENMTFPELQQLPEYQQYETNPVTGGPYEIASRTRNQEIVCKRRESWYMHDGKPVRSKPYFAEVRFRVMEDPNTALLALMSGRLDEYEIQMEQWVSQATTDEFYEKNTKVRAVQWVYFFFGWNNESPFFEDRRVREALSYAFDYREMFDKLLYSLCEPCTGIEYPTAWMAPKTPAKPYKQDLDKAEELLDAAGWIDEDGDGIREKTVNGRSVPFEFSMLVRQDPERIRICELMKFNLEQIGIRCNIQPIEATVMFERLMNKNFQAYYGGWGSGADPDTSENVWATKAIKDGRNFLQYSNPEVDRLFVEGRKEFDREKRGEIYGKIDELIFQDQPCTFLFWRSAFYGFNKDLRGYYFSPRGPYHYSPGFDSIWKVN